jgi:hypothetical protein
LHGNDSFVSVGLEIDAELAAEDDGVGELSRAARSHYILNIRLEKERAVAQIETISSLQNRLVALHSHGRIEQLLALFGIAQVTAEFAKNNSQAGGIGGT